MKYSQKELDDAELRDLISDAEAAEEQAHNGPFYPNVTAESLRSYAAKCRAEIGRKMELLSAVG